MYELTSECMSLKVSLGACIISRSFLELFDFCDLKSKCLTEEIKFVCEMHSVEE